MEWSEICLMKIAEVLAETVEVERTDRKAMEAGGIRINSLQKTVLQLRELVSKQEAEMLSMEREKFSNCILKSTNTRSKK